MTEHTLTDPAIVARVLETWPDAIVERPGNVLDFLLTPKPGVPVQVRITGPIANGGGQRATSVTADVWRIPIHERTPWPVVEAMIRAAIEHEEAGREFPTTSTDGRTVWACCLNGHGEPCQHRRNPDGTVDPVAVLPVEVSVHQTVTGVAHDGSFAVICNCLWERAGFATRHDARRAGDEHLAVANA